MRARVVDEDEGGDAREDFLETGVPGVKHGEEEDVGTGALDLSGEALNGRGEDERGERADRAAIGFHMDLRDREVLPIGQVFGLGREEGKDFMPAA